MGDTKNKKLLGQSQRFKRPPRARAKLNNFNQMLISDLPNKDLRIMVINMLTKVRRTMYEQSENFNKNIENISTKQKSQN